MEIKYTIVDFKSALALILLEKTGRKLQRKMKMEKYKLSHVPIFFVSVELADDEDVGSSWLSFRFNDLPLCFSTGVITTSVFDFDDEEDDSALFPSVDLLSVVLLLLVFFCNTSSMMGRLFPVSSLIWWLEERNIKIMR